jgi:hypothetical protein
MDTAGATDIAAVTAAAIGAESELLPTALLAVDMPVVT